MKAKWKFPSAGGGNISGLNETGITQFKSLPMQSVTKETIQDSLDARAAKDKPSIVKFSVFSISRDDIPDIDGLTKIFELGEKYWMHHEEAKEFFSNGIKTLYEKDIKVMAIQDYNTTGLSNIGGTQSGANSGGWIALVRSTGITEKGADSSGSFGIGKHAPFAASELQTVIYGTMNEENEIGFQGVSKIASFKDTFEDITQGTGYLGYVTKNDFQPIKDASKIPKAFRRSERGTDKFIIGLLEDDNWEIDVLTEAVSSYMLAILDGKLEVHISDFHLTKDTLATAISRIAEYDPNNLSLQFYEVLTSPETKKIEGTFDTDEGTKEVIELNLLASEGFKKRIVLYRGTGMKIYDRGHFRTPIEFAGVLVVKGERLNAVLRKMEPPTHDKWDPNLFKENVPYAKRLHRNINTWLNDQTRNLIDVSNIKSVELQGLEKLLPDVTQKEGSTIDLEKKQIANKVNQIKKRKKRRKSIPRRGIDLGKNPGVTPPPSHQPPKPNPKPGDKPNKPKPDSQGSNAEITLAKAFSTNQSDGTYIIRFWPATTGIRKFSLKSTGENNKLNAIEIINAKSIDGNSIPSTSDSIGPISFVAEEILEIRVQLKTKNKLAVEVLPN